MFGDFFQNFGLNDLLQQAFAAANAPQPADQSLHMAGLGPGTGPGAPQEGAGGLGAPPGTSGAEMAKGLPTAAGVAQGPTVPSGSPLSPGGGSPMGPGPQPGLMKPQSGLEGEGGDLVGHILKSFGMDKFRG